MLALLLLLLLLCMHDKVVHRAPERVERNLLCIQHCVHSPHKTPTRRGQSASLSRSHRHPLPPPLHIPILVLTSQRHTLSLSPLLLLSSLASLLLFDLFFCYSSPAGLRAHHSSTTISTSSPPWVPTTRTMSRTTRACQTTSTRSNTVSSSSLRVSPSDRLTTCRPSQDHHLLPARIRCYRRVPYLAAPALHRRLVCHDRVRQHVHKGRTRRAQHHGAYKSFTCGVRRILRLRVTVDVVLPSLVVAPSGGGLVRIRG